MPGAERATTSSSAAETPTSQATSSSSAVASSTPATTSTGLAVGRLDSVQLKMLSSEEKSPGVLQFSYSSISLTVEWMALSSGNAYGGEKCAAVITLVDPAGQIVTTDRQASCSGSTRFDLSSSRHATGDYTIKASIAPWDAPENPALAEKTFSVIARGV